MGGKLRDSFLSTSVSPLAIPDRLKTKLVYAAGGQVTTGSAFSDKIWNINSVFDPDQSGVGHQPRYFDQLSLLYNRYRVLSATFDLSVRQRSTHGINVFLIPTNATTGLTAGGIPAELRRSGVAKITSSNQPPAVMRVRFDPAAITGVTKTVYLADDRFQALTSANPTEAICAHQYVEAMDGATALDYEYMMQIVFEVEFYDALEPGSSVARAHERVAAAKLAKLPRTAPSGAALAAAPATAAPPPPVLVWSEAEGAYVPADAGGGGAGSAPGCRLV